MNAHSYRFALAAWLASTMPLLAGNAHAQSLERRITGSGDGGVQFTFAARPGVCGDGSTFVHDGLGGDNRIFENGNFIGGRRRGEWPACLPGPVRVVAWVTDGEIIRLRTYAGPLPSSGSAPVRDLGSVSVSDATSLLVRLAEQGRGRVADQALLPLVLADSVSPWPALLRLARDEQLPRAVRHNVAFWLSRGASAKLGLADADADSEDEVRASAVFALSQQPRAQAVPQLIDIARGGKRPYVRAQALFWLGQSGDSRAVELFAEILGGK
jgi:hypothetical protein